MRAKNLIFAVVLGVALAAGIFVASKMRQPLEPQSAFIIPVASELPEFTLQDQYGAVFDATSFRGQWDLVFFGFTNCPDICPATLQILANVKKQLMESGAETLPRIVLVSVDPERDTPELLARYVNYFGADNVGVSGELSETRKLTSALGIYFEKTTTGEDNYSVDHAAAVLVINPRGQFAALFSAPHIVADYLHDLPVIMSR